MPTLRIALIGEHALPLVGSTGPSSDPSAGGVDRLAQIADADPLVQTALALAAAGHHVDVLTRCDRPGLPTVVGVWGRVRVVCLAAGPPHWLPPGDLLAHMPQFLQAARPFFRGQPRYDLVHAHGYLWGWVGLALRQAFGVPLVTSLQGVALAQAPLGGGESRAELARAGIERALVLRSNRLLADCAPDAHELVQQFGACAAGISLVAGGVDVQGFRPGMRAAARQRLGLPPGQFLVLQPGWPGPGQGLDNVIEAMALLPPSMDAQLLVVGAGRPGAEGYRDDAGGVRPRADAHGLRRPVRVVGVPDRDRLRDWYLAADVVVSTPERGARAAASALGAMACGRPVVASDVAGQRQAVVDGVTGFLVPPRNPQVLAVRLAFLRASPSWCTAMGRAATDHVRQHCSWAAVAEQLGAVYQAVVAAASRAPAWAPARLAESQAAGSDR